MRLALLSWCRQMWRQWKRWLQRGGIFWLQWEGHLRSPKTAAASGSDAIILLPKRYSVALTKASPRHVLTLRIGIRKAVNLHFCCRLVLLYVCTMKIKITCHRGSVNWTAGWQRGGYWDTGRINDLSLFIKKCTAMWKTYLSLHPSGPFHLRFTCCTREAL